MTRGNLKHYVGLTSDVYGRAVYQYDTMREVGAALKRLQASADKSASSDGISRTVEYLGKFRSKDEAYEAAA